MALGRPRERSNGECKGLSSQEIKNHSDFFSSV